jgi:pimeloyl-ACP methyl ester carboxylesterase
MLGLLVVVVGCGGNDGDEAGPPTTSTPETTTTAAAPCGAEGVQAVTLETPEGIALDGALVGEGETGVVLGHQFRSDFCSWVPFAEELARRDIAALAVNFASASLEDDMVAGANELLRRGAQRIFLVGASMGGTAALVAAEKLDVAGVAAVSAPGEFSGLDALAAVRELDARALFLAGREDGEFARDARRLYRATSSRDKGLVMIAGYEHGTDLLRDPEAERALLDFIRGS